MIDQYLTADGLRAALVLACAVGQAVMSQWPYLRKWPETVPSRSAASVTPVVPIPWAFAIWGVIFLGCFGLAIWQALPAQLDDPLLRSIGWLAAASFALNAAWEYYVPKRDIGWPSVAIIVMTLVVLLAILSRLEAVEPHDATTFWLVAAPLQLFAGWISAATFVNLSSTLRLHGVEPTTARSLAFLALATALGATVAFWTGSLVYAAAVAWALFGIVMRNRLPSSDRKVGAVALAMIPAAPVAALLGG